MLHVRQSVRHQLELNVLVLLTRMSPETCMMAMGPMEFSNFAINVGCVQV